MESDIYIHVFFIDILRGGRYPLRRVNVRGEIPRDIALRRAESLVISPRGGRNNWGWNPYDTSIDTVIFRWGKINNEVPLAGLEFLWDNPKRAALEVRERKRTSNPIQGNLRTEIVVDHRRVFARRFDVPPWGYERNQTRNKLRAKPEPNAGQQKIPEERSGCRASSRWNAA